MSFENINVNTNMAIWTCRECGQSFSAVLNSFNERIIKQLCEKQVCLGCLEKIQDAMERSKVCNG